MKEDIVNYAIRVIENNEELIYQLDTDIRERLTTFSYDCEEKGVSATDCAAMVFAVLNTIVIQVLNLGKSNNRYRISKCADDNGQ